MVHGAPADLIASPTLCLVEYYDKHMVRGSLSTRGLLIGQLLSLQCDIKATEWARQMSRSSSVKRRFLGAPRRDVAPRYRAKCVKFIMQSALCARLWIAR